MKTTKILSAILLTLSVFGCTRQDIREMTVSMPGLKESDRAKVTAAIAKYDGIDKSSYRWDFTAGSLSLKYDSMKIAQANIRYAIEEAGVKVAFPEKTDRHAGH